MRERDVLANSETVNPVWRDFIHSLFSYDYLRKSSPLKEDILADPLSRVLYDESQGITSVAVTLYALSQARGITSGTEKITPGLVRTVARDSQYLIRDMLDELRSGSIRNQLSTQDLIFAKVQPSGSRASSADSNERLLEFNINSSVLENDNRTDTSSTRPEQKPQRFRKRKPPDNGYDEDDLRRLSTEGLSKKGGEPSSLEAKNLRSLRQPTD
jgi:hypothetical protein